MHPSVSVYDKSISKREYAERRSATGGFVVDLAEKLRDTLDMIGRLTLFDIDRITLDALRSADVKESANSAWIVVAWHRMMRPFDHAARTFKFDESVFIPIIEKDPESLFLYATILQGSPSKETYDKLRAQNAGIAADYFKYSKNYLIAENKIGNLGWLVNW